MLGYIPFIGEWLQRVVRGGADLGPATLVLFYAFHTTLIPVVLLLLMGFHFWRVRKAGGVVDPRPLDEIGEEETTWVSTLPDLLLRELAAGLALVAVVLVLALLFDAPLGAPANPGMSPNPAKAPWYFVGFQELQLHFHPLFAVVIIPGLAVIALLLIPYLKYDTQPTGPWFLSPAGRRTGAAATVAALVITPALIVVDELWLHSSAGLPSLIGRGLAPLALLAAAVVGFRLVLVRRLGASKAEVVQALFIFFFMALAVLTVTGAWFRGPGMALSWPWG
jgi:quinol-cytochrome oxidoreductase complex cytochrome b subunit